MQAKINKILSDIENKNKEIRVYEQKIEKLKQEIEDVQLKHFGISDGSMISIESFVKAIFKILERK